MIRVLFVRANYCSFRLYFKLTCVNVLSNSWPWLDPGLDQLDKFSGATICIGYIIIQPPLVPNYLEYINLQLYTSSVSRNQITAAKTKIPLVKTESKTDFTICSNVFKRLWRAFTRHFVLCPYRNITGVFLKLRS